MSEVLKAFGWIFFAVFVLWGGGYVAVLLFGKNMGEFGFIEDQIALLMVFMFMFFTVCCFGLRKIVTLLEEIRDDARRLRYPEVKN